MPSLCWLKSESGVWGPFRWQTVREWLVAGWIQSSQLVAYDAAGPFLPAGTDEKLTSRTKSLETLLARIRDTRSPVAKIPISRAQKKRLRLLGWPEDSNRIQNYFFAERLRATLEEIDWIAQKNLPDYEDLDWPDCWQRPPTKQEIQEREIQTQLDPPSWPKLRILDHFLGPHHGVRTTGEATRRIAEILSLSEKAKEWLRVTAQEPMSEKQYNRLLWWSKTSGEEFDRDLSKAEASDLIESWKLKYPELVDDWEMPWVPGEIKKYIREAFDEEMLQRRREEGPAPKSILFRWMLLPLAVLAIWIIVNRHFR